MARARVIKPGSVEMSLMRCLARQAETIERLYPGNHLRMSSHNLEGDAFRKLLFEQEGIIANPSTISRAWRFIRENGLLPYVNLKITNEEVRPRKKGRGKGEKQWTICRITPSTSNSQQMTATSSKEAP